RRPACKRAGPRTRHGMAAAAHRSRGRSARCSADPCHGVRPVSTAPGARADPAALACSSQWRRWTPTVATAACGLAGTIAGRSPRLAATAPAPELDSTTAVIARSLATEIDSALAFGIPLPALAGIDPWFDDVIAANPAVLGLAIADRDGRIRHARQLPADIRAALAASP